MRTLRSGVAVDPAVVSTRRGRDACERQQCDNRNPQSAIRQSIHSRQIHIREQIIPVSFALKRENRDPPFCGKLIRQLRNRERCDR